MQKEKQFVSVGVKPASTARTCFVDVDGGSRAVFFASGELVNTLN